MTESKTCPICHKRVWFLQDWSYDSKINRYKTPQGEKGIVHWIRYHNDCIRKGGYVTTW